MITAIIAINHLKTTKHIPTFILYVFGILALKLKTH